MSYIALAAVAANGFIWLCAELSHILVLKQLAVVGMLVSGFWGVLGNTIALSMSFPLLFLFFMVPMGEELIPWLIEFTTTFTVNMLRLTGLPVYREGSFFTLTSGNWSVVEACSGISYLIASATLGFVFAYLNYSHYWKRALFMLLSCIVPIFANGLRAYMIVMIGHLSDMQLAVGVDHLIYGGIFFGLVMLLLFYLGSFWRDPPFTPIALVQKNTIKQNTGHLFATISLLAIFFGIWPLASNWLLNKQGILGLPAYVATSGFKGWERLEHPPQWLWAPMFDQAIAQKTSFYTDGKNIIGIYYANFGKEVQGAELVNYNNALIRFVDEKRLRITHERILSVPTANNTDLMVNLTIIKETDGPSVLAMDCYQLGNRIMANRFLAKGWQLIKRLTGDTSPEAKLVIWTQIDSKDARPAEQTLKRFLLDWAGKNSLLPSP